tara:strand:+ start:1712 stop:2254 length:543 start_codon:yes stop_codon:yes gene_type:complete
MAFNIFIDNIKYDLKLSKPGWCSLLMPSALQSTHDEIIEDEFIDKKLNKLNLSNNIKLLFKAIRSTNQEIYINEWTILSIETILKLNEKYKKDNITSIDFAFKYQGLNNIKVAFYYPKLKCILYRNDGGSNLNDRKNKYNNLKILNNISINNNEIEYSGINFKMFLDEITCKKFETSVIF